MQQANTAEAPSGSPSPAAAPLAAGGNTFVINLMSSTTPVALKRPDHAGLKRFTFFVSRRLEEGRERFRLHMGYFDTQEEAEKLLDIVRTLYPGAWAGAAPGRRLGFSPTTAQAPSAAAVPAVEPIRVSTPTATPEADSSARAPKPRQAPTPERAPKPVAAVPETRPPAPKDAPSGREAERRAAAMSLSDVRAAIASLGDGTREMPAVIPTVMPPAEPIAKPVAQPRPAAPVTPAVQAKPDPPPKAATPRKATPNPAASAPALSDSRVLQLLETGPASAAAAATKISAERSCFAVQLVWSVRPIAMAQVPQLAIFSAYTLYGAEGNRDGRRWYGLRLGFFTDAVSAKQVAHYVRGDFATVSVVPVTAREREQALTAAARPKDSSAAAAAPSKRSTTTRPPAKSEEFTFIDDEPVQIRDAQPSGPVPPAAAAATSGAPAALPRATRPAPGKRAKLRPGATVQGRTRVKPKTLEQTLEILGANLLEVEDERAASINDSGVRHVRLEVAKDKPSKLSRLLDRLSERTGS